MAPSLAELHLVRALHYTVGIFLASFPGPREGGEKGLVSTVCACALTETRIRKWCKWRLRSHMVQRVLSILLHWSYIHKMRDDMTTIALPPATDLPDIRYSNQMEESGSILAQPGQCDRSHIKTSHLSITGHCSSSIQERLATWGHRRAQLRAVPPSASESISSSILKTRVYRLSQAQISVQ